MSVLQIKTELGFNELLNVVEQLDTSELETLISKVITLRAKRKKSYCSEQESELRLKINQKLSADAQQRLNDLFIKRQAEQLSHNEQQELIDLNEHIEQNNVERITLIHELAKLRGVTLEAMMENLGIDTPRYV
jgi:hypothetical protein